jgi:hypothetical protein
LGALSGAPALSEALSVVLGASARDVAAVLVADAGDGKSEITGSAVAGFCGSRTPFAGTVFPAGELFRVRVFTASAAEPVSRAPAVARARAVLVLMAQL